MPCDTVTLQSVNLANALPSVLADALRAEGFTITEETAGRIRARSYTAGTVTWEKGAGVRVSAARPQRTLSAVTKAYGRQAVKQAARRAGWRVNQTSDNTMTVQRR